MKPVSRAFVSLAALVALAACSTATPLELAIPRHEPSHVLFFRTADRLKGLELATGKIVFGASNAVVDPGWTRVFSATDAGKGVLTTLEARSGARLSRTDVPASVLPSVVSGSGKLVAFTEPRSQDATPWLPDGRKRTKLVIVDPNGVTRPRTLRLAGNLEPEAFSTDDQRLFMIEYMPATAPSHYSVRRVNLETGKVSPIRRRNLKAPNFMRGTGRMQVLAPNGQQLYTLYTQQGPNYAHRRTPEHEKGNTVHAFVHVLNLEHAWAHCVDLPAPFGTGLATASALAQSPDGSRLYVTDWSKGAIATIDPVGLKVQSVGHVDLGSADNETFAAAGGDGSLYVAGSSTVVVVHASTLRATARWRMRSEVSGLALSRDGTRLYVGQKGSVLTLDAASGKKLGSMKAGGLQSIEHLS
ncbi:MAG: hypothetical protein H0V97_01655 [Actinobacteria bacterium]|nr:hypothetical protein [Actinomycetota bacterium]